MERFCRPDWSKYPFKFLKQIGNFDLLAAIDSINRALPIFVNNAVIFCQQPLQTCEMLRFIRPLKPEVTTIPGVQQNREGLGDSQIHCVPKC